MTPCPLRSGPTGPFRVLEGLSLVAAVALVVGGCSRPASGEAFDQMERAAIHRTGGQRYLHYMKAIPLGGLCVTCHGTKEQIAPAVQTAIDELYPTDAAVGFSPGELRGAFTFVKVLPES